jgi:hypothetical protein
MNSTEKRRFIRCLARNVAKDLCSKVAKMPREWDGIELRELMAEAFQAQTVLSSRSYWGDASGRNADRRRLREYRNECLARALP